MKNVCVKCNQDFETKRKDTKYCSSKCKKAQQYLNQNQIMKKQCQNCKQEFETRKEKTVFCSISCSNSNRTNDEVTLICKECNQSFTKPYILRDVLFCSRSCATTHQNKIMYAEGNDIIRNKISETQKDQFSSGKRIHSFLGKNLTDEHKENISKTRIENGSAAGENNPMFGKHHSNKTREKQSQIRTDKILNGEYHKWFSRGKTYSHKMGREFYFQSSWERDFISKIDSDKSISSFYTTPFSIDYVYLEHKRKYIPDLMLTKNNQTFIVEIKPSCFLEAKINLAKFKAAKEYCDEKGFIFEVWTEKSNPYLESNRESTY